VIDAERHPRTYPFSWELICRASLDGGVVGLFAQHAEHRDLHGVGSLARGELTGPLPRKRIPSGPGVVRSGNPASGGGRVPLMAVSGLPISTDTDSDVAGFCGRDGAMAAKLAGIHARRRNNSADNARIFSTTPAQRSESSR
jgi:hypothetical protein